MLIIGCDPQLVSELTAVVDPADEGRDDPDLDASEVHEAECRAGQVLGRDLGQRVPRVRARDRQADERQIQDLERHGSVGRQVGGEQRGWWTSAASEPKRKYSSASLGRATVNSPTI